MELLHRSSSCLELTAASPSLPVHQSQSVSSTTQDSSFQAAAFHWLFLWKLLKSLNWTELNITRQLLCNVQLQAEHMSNLWSTGLNELSLFKQTAVDDRHECCVVAFKPLLSATQQVNCQPSVTQYQAYQHLTQCPVRGHALYRTLSVYIVLNCCTFISSFPFSTANWKKVHVCVANSKPDTRTTLNTLSLYRTSSSGYNRDTW